MQKVFISVFVRWRKCDFHIIRLCRCR